MRKAIQMGPNTKVKEKQCEGTTTQQLLADLTDDFEEAITAQICLSNQLLEANIESVESSKEDILILKTESVTAKSTPLPMELNNTAPIATATATTTTTTTTTILSEVKEEQNLAAEKEVAAVSAEIDSQTKIVDKTSSTKNDEIPATKQCETQETAGTSLSGEIAETQPTASTSTTSKQDVIRRSIISLEELPPVRTDSTMTASEVEDNIEERLSQLDGNSTVHPSCEETSEGVAAAIDALTATRARTPTTASQRVEPLQPQQQQLHRTPPHTQQQQLQQQLQNTYTPQSSSSSVNTMGSSSTHIPKDFMKDSSAGELEDQDIEEVLKALKGLDSSTAADTICDLNVLFNEVYTTFNYEEINSQHNSSACGSKAANPLKEIQAEIEKKQQTMQRKIDFLLRRLRKIQTRYMCKHTSEEISGLFEWSARIASKSAKLLHEDDVTDRQQLNYAEQKSHPVTSTQLSSMLRKIEMAANAQQLTTAASSTSVSNIGRRKTTKKVTTMAAANSSPDLANAANNDRKVNTVTVVPTFDVKITDEIGHVTGLLQSEMHEIQNAIDSDATESSSGGESADEMVTYNNQLQQSLQIAKRAAWRYSRDRAAIASRWSWLLSQISDLEIKIRQHSELHQELLRTKGPAIQGMETITSTKTASATPNSTPYNGFKAAQGQPSSGIKMETSDEETSCCRTRGILASNFRKRKLFQTANIHTFSKKAARPSTIKCGCQWPLLPCALCTGRADPTSPRDLPDTMMLADRVALLDPGYHPVLSFPGDISNSIHFEALCRLPDWQQRVLRCPVKNIAKSLWRAERDALHATLSGGKKNSETVKRKYIKKKDLLREQQKQANIGNGTGTLSMSSTPLVANKSINNIAMTTKTLPRINNNNNISHNNHNYHHQMSDYHQPNYAQYNPSQAHSSSISNTIRNNNRKLSSSVAAAAAAAGANSTYHYNHHALNDNNYSNSELNYLHSDSWDSQVTRSRTSSPTHSGSKKNKSLDRRNRTSYDIDNIVIPYSVAAATRVELLPYKEIPTPKWRIIEDSLDVSQPMSDAEHCTNNLKDRLPSSVDCKNQNDTDNDGNCDTSKSLTDDRLSKTIKSAAENNIASDANHAVETTSPSNPNIVDAAADSSNSHNKCRLTTKRTYSEKENSVDPTDAFDTIKDSNTKSHTANDLKSSESKAKILKTADDLMQHKSNAAANDLRQYIEDVADNLNKDVEANATTNNCMEGSEEDGVEDITDEAMVLRHERALIEERQRLKFPWSTRSRANRRIDSRIDWSSGANTPDPASPATNTPSVGGGDLDSIPSPVAPLTPLNPLDSIAEVVEPVTALNAGTVNSTIAPTTTLSWQNYYNKRYERRRTTSAKNNKEQQERRSTSPDQKELVPPFEPRKFPIPNEVFENMIKIDNMINANSMMTSNSLENHLKNETFAKRPSHKNNNINTIISDHREVGIECDESELGFHEVDIYMQQHLTASDEEYQPYHVSSFSSRKNALDGGDSDVDTSEADPFSDDDPNDPEWKGETEERDKLRRKI